MTTCPSCRAPAKEFDTECFACGVIFSKWETRQKSESTLPPSPVIVRTLPKKGPLEKILWVIGIFMGVVFSIALVVGLFARYHYRNAEELMSRAMGGTAEARSGQAETPAIAAAARSAAALMDREMDRLEQEVALLEPDVARKEVEAYRLQNDLRSDEDVLERAIGGQNLRAILIALHAGVTPRMSMLANLRGEHQSRIVKAMIAAGMDVNEKVGRQPPLAWALSRPDVFVQLVDAGSRIDTPSNMGEPLITGAAYLGCDACVTALLAKGADPTEKSSQGRTALDLAMEQNHMGIVSQLTSSGAKLEDRGGGQSLLMLGAWEGKGDVVRSALRDGYDPRKTDEQGKNALHFAATGGNVECIKLILDAAPEHINSRDNFSLTPLHEAAESGCLECVNLLLAAGATKDVYDAGGKTPYDHSVDAANRQSTAIVRNQYGKVVERLKP